MALTPPPPTARLRAMTTQAWAGPGKNCTGWRCSCCRRGLLLWLLVQELARGSAASGLVRCSRWQLSTKVTKHRAFQHSTCQNIPKQPDVGTQKGTRAQPLALLSTLLPPAFALLPLTSYRFAQKESHFNLNSGLFYLAANPRTVELMQVGLHSFGYVIA